MPLKEFKQHKVHSLIESLLRPSCVQSPVSLSLFSFWQSAATCSADKLQLRIGIEFANCIRRANKGEEERERSATMPCLDLGLIEKIINLIAVALRVYFPQFIISKLRKVAQSIKALSVVTALSGGYCNCFIIA